VGRAWKSVGGRGARTRRTGVRNCLHRPSVKRKNSEGSEILSNTKEERNNHEEKGVK